MTVCGKSKVIVLGMNARLTASHRAKSLEHLTQLSTGIGKIVEHVLYVRLGHVRLGEIEVSLLGVLNQHPIPFELAHRAVDDAIEKPLHANDSKSAHTQSF